MSQKVFSSLSDAYLYWVGETNRTEDSVSLTYLLTAWCRVLLEKLTGLQLVKKFPAFHGTRRFITALTSVSILGQPNPVHIPTSHLLEIHPNIIHPSTPRSPQWSRYLRFPHQDPIHPLSSPIRAKCPTHLILLDFITRTILGEQYKSSVCLQNHLRHSSVQVKWHCRATPRTERFVERMRVARPVT